jgi:hypothetical protein
MIGNDWQAMQTNKTPAPRLGVTGPIVPAVE